MGFRQSWSMFPRRLRIRKELLNETDRKKAGKKAAQIVEE